MMKRLLLTLLPLLLAVGFPSAAQQFSFVGVPIENGANTIYALLQDDSGLMWVGTNQGLCNFDGYGIHRCYEYGSAGNSNIYCGLEIDGTLYLGSDNGVLVYDTATDRYVETGVAFPRDVRAIVRNGDELWVGSLNGLYRYDPTRSVIEDVGGAIPHNAVYSLARTAEGDIWVGTYNGLCRYSPADGEFHTIRITQAVKKSNLFVNVLLDDPVRGCMWIGTEGALYRYDSATEAISIVAALNRNSVKSLALSSGGELVVGTDNGLFVCAAEGVRQYRHDSRIALSLANNIVWCLEVDRLGNIWAGTEYQLSVVLNDSDFEVMPLSTVTDRGDGNRFYNILRDSHGYLWLGGTNGLIRYDDRSGESRWYMMGSTDYPIAHNRIRDIYEDADHELWVASDGSINRYDYRRGQFVNYTVTDSTGSLNANWAYSISVDELKRVWIGSYLGAILIADRGRLIASGGEYVADVSISAADGLPNNLVHRIEADADGNKWALLYKNNSLIKLDGRTCCPEVIDLQIEEGNSPADIMVDGYGNPWCTLQGGVVRLTADGRVAQRVHFPMGNDTNPLAIEQVDDNIWVSTTDGVWAVDIASGAVKLLPLPNELFTSIYYDKAGGKVLLGSVDKIAKVAPSVIDTERNAAEIVVTGISVNGEPYADPRGSVRRLDGLVLSHSQNNIGVEFSDLRYTLDNKRRFEYRLRGTDDTWTLLPEEDNHIRFTNLHHGSYTLEIRRADSSDAVKTLGISIEPVWYLSSWAIAVYGLLVAALALWVVGFFRTRNRMRIERIERDKTLETVRNRMDFLTNVSHEFKTPLSMIVGPVSKMLTDVREPELRRHLESVYDNAMGLNALIHRALEANRMDDDTDQMLIYSQIEAVEFCRSIFEGYREAYPDKRLVFSTENEKVYMEVDAVKIESVINNVVSNACKYSPAGATVAFSMERTGDSLRLRISDDGIGIPHDEIPLIFQRLYQSSRTSGGKEGTGIGLYLAKSYVDMHHGSIIAESTDGVGTVFTIVLPITDCRSVEEVRSIPESVAGDVRPKILIVDDNIAIADFMVDILKEEYQCFTASNGKAGLAICGSVVPDLMIVDVMMPVMDGLEMCRRLKSNKLLAAVPIILLTAKDDKATETESMRLGIDTFMSKPFEAPLLSARVHQLLAARRELRSKVRIEEITSAGTIEAESGDEKLLAEIARIIEDNIDEPDLNVGYVCRKSGMSAKQLYRMIKRYIGISPVDYIRQIRIKKAAMLLERGKFTVAEVMYMVGFGSASYFAKCFQAQFGCSPKQYIDRFK